MLHCLGTTFGAYFNKNLVTLLAIGPEDSDFDEFMTFQCTFNFGYDRYRQALLADHHNRIKQVGSGPQITSLCRIYRFHSIILSAGSYRIA